MSRVIAFFDFDGTITTRDSLLEFVKYCKGNNAFRVGFLLNSPFLIAYKLNIISNQRAKEIFLHYFFGKTELKTFAKYCDDFSQQVIPLLIRAKALKEIRKLQDAGVEVVIVSASPENWLIKWCNSLGIKCIATRLLVTDGRITGKIAGKNCHGDEKVRRIRESYDLSGYTDIYCYGDTAGDKPMLLLADHAFYKPFR